MSKIFCDRNQRNLYSFLLKNYSNSKLKEFNYLIRTFYGTISSFAPLLNTSILYDSWRTGSGSKSMRNVSPVLYILATDLWPLTKVITICFLLLFSNLTKHNYALNLAALIISFNCNLIYYYRMISICRLQLKLGRKSSLSWPWRALTDRWPFSGSCDFRSVQKESTSRACTSFLCHVMRWILFVGSIQTRLQISCLSRPNQSPQEPSNIDDRGFEGVKCAGCSGETGRLLWI